uniref:Endoplasmic reticulum oxidoreductin 1 n=1 Tax=Timspurckia oligopyrenoides TaxID=708627 RepID=A0A7S0ZDJ2_9RHOD
MVAMKILVLYVFGIFLVVSSVVAGNALDSNHHHHVNVFRGPIQDCFCDGEVIEDISESLHEKLHKLVQLRYFRIFQLNLQNECPYWDDNELCFSSDCSICECEDHEVPLAWRHQGSCSNSHELCTQLEQPKKQFEQLQNSLKGDSIDDVKVEHDQWVEEERENGNESWNVVESREDFLSYVDLIKNPERFTGYKGDSARKAWHAIYTENCFTFSKNCAENGICTADSCRAERVLFRIISGLHTSINAVIVKEFVFPTESDRECPDAFIRSHPWWKFWKIPHADMYKWRIGHFPERIENLYFTVAMMLRALVKARDVLDPKYYGYVTGDELSDLEAEIAVDALYQHSILSKDCKHVLFDESDVFPLKELDDMKGVDNLRDDFRAAFRNISSIMDCVGCESCKLWGKVQFLGVGTALKILFEDEENVLSHQTKLLKRNEVIALFNTMHKLTESVLWIQRMETIAQNAAMAKRVLNGVVASCCVIVLVSLVAAALITRTKSKQTDTIKKQL